MATAKAIAGTISTMGKDGSIPPGKHDRVMETFEGFINRGLAPHGYFGEWLPHHGRAEAVRALEAGGLASMRRRMEQPTWREVTVDTWHWGPTTSTVRHRANPTDAEVRRAHKVEKRMLPEDHRGHPGFIGTTVI